MTDPGSDPGSVPGSRGWQTVPAEPDPNNPTVEPGVYDVKIGADGTALDGTKYSEWD